MYRLLATFNIFLGLSRAATVFLHPQDSIPPRLSPQQANLVLAAHLGLEQFEVVHQPSRLDYLFRERDFVGQGDQSALLLLIDETYARDIVPSAFQPSFSFSEPSSDALVFSLKTCHRRASHVYAHVAGEPVIPSHGIPRTLDMFSTPTPANEAFLAEISTLDHFAALEVTGISKLAASYGRSSEHYKFAADTLRATIEAILADKSVRLALVTYAPSAVEVTRSLQPVKALSSCFSSLFTCAEATNSCSGHGQCTNVTRAGQECFVCACATTAEKCERRDVSGPFVLITGTVITLILLMGGSVSLLCRAYLAGGVAGGVRRE
ncbi:hypothetical protein EV363DRAFT_1322860 [Boletus edulis]|nr:hypothetical protein EV363DRAFT_1322860 [Boletus edulis]